MVRAKHVSVIHLGEIVVLGGQPEDRYCGNSLSVQLLSQACRRQRLINAVCGTGEQAHLLPRHHCYRLGTRQQVERWTVAVTIPQDRHQFRPPVRRII